MMPFFMIRDMPNTTRVDHESDNNVDNFVKLGLADMYKAAQMLLGYGDSIYGHVSWIFCSSASHVR